MKKEVSKKAYICDLMALCNILEEFEEFSQKIAKFISVKNNMDLIYKLGDVSRGKFCFPARGVKKFYQENKEVIDIINRYSSIERFICSDRLEFFYQYILKNKEKLDQIISLLQKISELGFQKLELNEDLDFTASEYKIYSEFDDNFSITYLDNIEVLPNYESCVKYKTTGSNYRMDLQTLPLGFSKYGGEITVNSLLFDSRRLPEKITKESIFDQILKLKSDQKEKCTSIRNSVDLSVSILDLDAQLNETNRTINKLDGVKSKSELLEVLSNIKEDVEKLKTMSIEYDSNILKETPSIRRETLEEEKQLYLKKRFWSRIDID